MEPRSNIIDQLLQNRIATHVLFWFIILAFSTGLASLSFGVFRDHLINNLALLPSQMLAAYALAYYLVPDLLMKKKYLRFVGAFLLSGFILLLLARLSIIYIAEPFIREYFEQETLMEVILDPLYLLVVYLPAVYLFPLVFLTVKTIKERFQQKHQLEILQKEKARTELKFLKAQIHPHFLFNTLNNLYALTLEKSDTAPEVVVKLSEILDYILYQGSEPKVSISKEVDLIRNYIDLELLRYGEKLDLKFEQAIDDPQTEIAPLILLTLVENAFKHGASGNLMNPLIHINLTVEDKELYFKAYNNIPVKVKKDGEPNKKGVGSSNIKRQLNLIYPERHELTVIETEETYEVSLRIELG